MKKAIFSRPARWLAPLLLGLTLTAPVFAASLSISQTPLFITIALPPNITVLLDDSGSMTWAHVPDDLGNSASARVNVNTSTTTTVTATPATYTFGTVTSTPNTISSSVVVTNGTVNSASVVATSGNTSTSVTVTTGTINHTAVIITGPSGGKYTYSCPAGYTLNPSSPTKGTSSTAAGYTCNQQTYNYSCPATYSLSPSSPTSGTSSTASGYTCTKIIYTFSCPSGYTQSSPWTSSGSTSASFGSDTCTQQTYNYSCASGYTLSGPTSGTSSSGSGDTCTEITSYTYSCSAGFTRNGPSSGSTSTPTSTTCQQPATYTYSCPSGYTLSGATSGTSSSPSTSTSSCSGGTYATKTVWIPDTYHYKSATYNPLAYNPAITYLPGYDNSGNLLPNAVFTAAYCNPYNTSAGTVDLSTAYQATVTYNPTTSCSTLMSSTNGGSASTSDEVDSCDYFTSTGCHSRYNPQTAFYYVYAPTSSNAVTNGCTNVNTDDSCYTKVVVSATSGPGGTDERTNFANWWSFYRTRNLTTNTSANRAFTSLSTTFRVAWRDLNTMVSSTTPFSSTGIKDWGGTSYDNRIGIFTGQHRKDFFNWLTKYPANNGTPLRTGLQSIGQYYQTSGVDSPYAFTPHVTDSPEYVCRPNYAVVMTDGLWNTDSISSYSNYDNAAKTLPDGTAYPSTVAPTSHPYSDSSSNSLADIAFYYWANNLRSDLGTSTALQYMPFTKAVTVVDSTNKTVSVPPYWNAENDPASWPHMVTFTVGLGMTSTITNPVWGGNTYAGGFPDVVTGTAAWPSVSSDSANNVYDLWHAAINSRGQFFSADTPQDMAAAFTSIVNRIQGRVGSSSAIAVNSTRLDSDTLIYQAQFNSASWTGEVIAYSINANGSIGNQVWLASAQIPSANSRSIFTWDDTANSGAGGGISFLWSSLNSTEQGKLNTNLSATNDGQGSSRLSYLRGDQSNEQNSGGTFRNRSQVLGDIVNSNPEFVGAQDFGFDRIPGEGASYDSYVATKHSRTPMLYVGANDGMMHALNAASGAEVFAYVPRGIYGNLSALTDPAYTHQYYVDGSGTAVDAYVNGAWTTLMPFSTGAGSREVFLMDVSSPASFTASDILWDYDGTIAGDSDMGYVLGSANVARMNDGDWYVIFGNGYNSPNQHAVLYLYNLRTKVLRKFDTQVGSSSLNNGMSSASPVDFNNDRIVDAIYAGDLQGNLWKLDVSSANNGNWKFTFSASSQPAPLFTATDSNGTVQPITDRPQVGLNSSGQVMVYFGTGTYFQTGDNTVGSNPPVQTFYGVMDDLGSASTDQVSRNNLLQQFVVSEQTVNSSNFRVTTNYSLSSGQQGWYIDLNFPSAQGERVVSDAVLESDRVVFVTLIPQGNACQFGGISWLMELGLDNGGQLGTSPYDINSDGKFNSNDYVTVTYTDPKTNASVTAQVPVSGRQSPVGIIKTPGIIHGAKQDTKVASGSTGAPPWAIGESSPSGAHRLSWQQLSP